MWTTSSSTPPFFIGHPWTDDAPQTGPSQLGVMVGGSADDARFPPDWTTEGFAVAKALFDAMTRADETTSGESQVRTSPDGLARCTWRPPGGTNPERAECLFATMLGATTGVVDCPPAP